MKKLQKPISGRSSNFVYTTREVVSDSLPTPGLKPTKPILSTSTGGGGASIYTANGTTTDEERILNTPNGLLEMFIGTKSGIFEVATDSFMLSTESSVASEIPGLNTQFHFGVMDAEGEVFSFAYMGDYNFNTGTLSGFMHVDGKPQISHTLLSGDNVITGVLMFDNNKFQLRYSASDDVTDATASTEIYFGGHNAPQYTFKHDFKSLDHTTPATFMQYESSIQHSTASNNSLFNAIYSRASKDTDYLLTFGTNVIGTFIGMESETNNGTISIGQYNSSSGAGALISCDDTNVTLDGELVIKATTDATAGTVASYLTVNVNGTDYKIPLHSLS